MKSTIKIDWNNSSYYIYAVYRLKPRRFLRGDEWEKLESFEKIEDARKYAESIVELPIYV